MVLLHGSSNSNTPFFKSASGGAASLGGPLERNRFRPPKSFEGLHDTLNRKGKFFEQIGGQFDFEFRALQADFERGPVKRSLKRSENAQLHR
jgi:hypothetical protein